MVDDGTLCPDPVFKRNERPVWAPLALDLQLPAVAAHPSVSIF
jgi:hypothetical protein